MEYHGAAAGRRHAADAGRPHDPRVLRIGEADAARVEAIALALLDRSRARLRALARPLGRRRRPSGRRSRPTSRPARSRPISATSAVGAGSGRRRVTRTGRGRDPGRRSSAGWIPGGAHLAGRRAHPGARHVPRPGQRRGAAIAPVDAGIPLVSRRRGFGDSGRRRCRRGAARRQSPRPGSGRVERRAPSRARPPPRVDRSRATARAGTRAVAAARPALASSAGSPPLHRRGGARRRVPGRSPAQRGGEARDARRARRGGEARRPRRRRSCARTSRPSSEIERGWACGPASASSPRRSASSVGADLCRTNLETIARAAAERGRFVRIDMEDSSTTSATLGVYRALRAAGHDNVGIVLQARLRRTLDDARALADLRPSVRLCKGIYLEPEEVAYQDDREVGERFLRDRRDAPRRGLLRRVRDPRRPAGRAGQAARARSAGSQPAATSSSSCSASEPELADRLVAERERVRIYVPYGRRWYEYSLRRLQENPRLATQVALDPVRRPATKP